MNFILDENVPQSAANFLVEQGHSAQYVRDLIPEGSVDPLVAFVAEDQGAILLSFDGDFQSIAPRIPNGQKARFKKLSRIYMRCNEYQASQRLEKALQLVQNEFDLAKSQKDQRMMITVGKSYIRTER